MQDGRLQEERVRETSKLLIAKKPRGYMAILHHLVYLVKTDIANRTATIQSATTLDNGAQQAIQDKLVSQYGSDLLIQFKHTPELIGGLRVQVGSDVFDGSLKGRLQHLEAQF